MIINKNFSENVTLSWDDYFYPTILEDKFVVYRFDYLDGTFYIGKTKRPFEERIKEHIDDANSQNGKKLNELGWAKISILDYANDENELKKLEMQHINNALLSLGFEIEKDIDMDLVHKFMVNEIVYKS
jgi:predicted GIY-YIG superfamily endonuclease